MEDNNNEMLELGNVQSENIVTEPNYEVKSDTFNTSNGNDKKNLKVFVGILVALAIFAGLIALAISAFKSDEQKFFELLVKKQSIVALSEELNERAEKNGEISSKIVVDLNKIAESVDEELDEEVVIGLNLLQTLKNKNASGNLELTLNDDSLVTIEYAKTDELYGLRLKDATEKYLALRNEDLSECFEKFDIEMPDKILTPEDFEEVVDMDKSDVNKILKKYIKVFAEASKDRVKVEKGVKVKLGDKEVKTTKYTLELTERLVMDMALAMLEELKDDKKNVELVLDDLESILELMEENGYPVEDMYGLEADDIPTAEEFLEEVREVYEEGKEIDFDEYYDDEDVILKISVYEYKGKTVATKFEDEYEDGFEFKCYADKDLYVEFVAEEDGDEVASFKLEGTLNKKLLDAKFIVEAEREKIELFTIKQEYSNKTKNLVKLNDKNALILNDASEDNVEEYGEELVEGMEKIAEDLEDIFEDAEIVEDIFGGMTGTTTVHSAQFSMFAQEFGDYSFDFTLGPVSLLIEKYGLQGIAVPKAQIYYMAATDAEYEAGILVPEGIEFVTELNKLPDANLYNYSEMPVTEQYWGNGDIACWEIKDSQIEWYNDNTKFYGDNLGVEKHFVTEKGFVFTLPGFPRVVDGENRMYISPEVYYNTDSNYMDVIDSNAKNIVEAK